MSTGRRLLGLLAGFAFFIPVRGEDAAAADPVRSFLEARVKADPDDLTAWNRLGGLYLVELRRTGDLAALARAETAARESLRAVPGQENPGGLALRAQVAQAMHRFASARDDGLVLTRIAPGRAEAWMLLGDAQFELGDYAEAERAWGELARLEPDSITTEIRRSRLAWLRGETTEAGRRLDAALAAAAGMSPAPAEMLAWCRVRRGYLAFSAGDLDAAETAYRAALKDWPGWYAAEDHLAEVLAAKGSFEESITLYRTLAERVRRPELWQALGDVFSAAGRGAEAAPWHDRALAAYLADAEAGGGQYGHHLAGFYSDIRPDPAEAVRWARKDMELRHTAQAWDALGWALYQAHDYKAAAVAQENALTPGTRDAHLLFHAALIFAATGDVARGGACLRAATKENPRVNGFHVHR